MGEKTPIKMGKVWENPPKMGKILVFKVFCDQGLKKKIGEKPEKKMEKVWDNISADLKMRSENMDTTGKIWENET